MKKEKNLSESFPNAVAHSASVGFYREKVQGREVIRTVCVRGAPWPRGHGVGEPQEMPCSGTVWSRGSVESGVWSATAVTVGSSQSFSWQTRDSWLLEQGLRAPS